jgi:hypothetical protein
MTPNVCHPAQAHHAVDCEGSELLAEIDSMIASGKKIDPREQRQLNASMEAEGFSQQQRAGILAAVRNFNRDGGGVGPREQANLSSLVEAVAVSNALRTGSPQGGDAGAHGGVAMDPKVRQANQQLEAVTAQAGKDGRITSAEMKQIRAANRAFLDAVKAAGAGGGADAAKSIDTGPMSGKIAHEIDRRMADGQFSRSDKKAVNAMLGAAGFDKQSRAEAMDSIQKMMLDGLTETMKKRHGGKGGSDDGKAAPSGGGGGVGGCVSGGVSGSGGVSIGEIARVLGEVLNEQFKKLVDAANALGENPSAQQTAQLQALSAQVNANAGALTNAQRSAEEALKAVARA